MGEPGRGACWNLTTGEELPAEQQEDWCKAPWCWVDPCACGLADVMGGYCSYFNITAGNLSWNPVLVAFSYSNCDPNATQETLWGPAAEGGYNFTEYPCPSDSTIREKKHSGWLFERNTSTSNPILSQM